MNLKEAREIARKVGATIEEKKTKEVFSRNDPDYVPKDKAETSYVVRFGVCRIGENGTREQPVLSAPTPRAAAELAVIETGRMALELTGVAKRVYVDSDMIFGARRT